MHHLLSIDSASGVYRRGLTFCAVLLLAVGLDCKSSVQKVSTDIGGGMFKGDPPMCYQYRGEASPTVYASNLFMHANNTCSYAVDCLVYDDVTEKKQHVVLAPFESRIVLLAVEVKASRVELKLECTWKP
jgi:hypothetical protein